MTVSNLQAIYPLTPVQEGILFHTLYAPDSPLYFQQYTAQFHGQFDVDAFRAAWDGVIDRHAVLRSLLTWEGRERPLQVVRDQVTPEWHVEDWSGKPHAELLETFLAADRGRGFVLDQAPLMRFALFTIDDRTTQFVWSHHHIIIDGWSMGIVLDEVMRIYSALTAGGEPELSPPVDYRGYVSWLHERDDHGAETWWTSYLNGVTGPTPLPIDDVTRDSPWAERHDEHVVRLDEAATRRVGDFARQNGLTMNTVVRAAWTLLLARYSGQDDVVFGATVAGRPPELDGSLDMVGLFINTLPVRATVAPAKTVLDWLTQLQSEQMSMAPFESTPLVDVQRWSAAAPNEPLFTSLLVFENVPNPGAGSDELVATNVRYLQRSNYPLAVLVMPGSELEFIVLYDADRYTAGVIARLANQLVHVLGELVTDANRLIGSIEVLPPDELHEILVDWNATEAEIPDTTAYGMIEAAAAAAPSRSAVIDAAGELSYNELMDRAGTVTAALSELAGPGDRVAVAMDRSAAMVVAIVGVLATGAAYVPIDPQSPLARRELLLADTSAVALLTDRSDWTADVPIVQVGPDGATAIATSPGAAPSTSPNDLAYVLYTSGSTGQPKGVAVTNRNLVNSTNARHIAYGSPVDTFLLLSPFHFDSSVAGIFSSLMQGGTLVLPGPDLEKDVAHLAQLIAKHGVTHTLALPSLYELLLEHADPADLASLRLVMVAGEACAPSVVEQHFSVVPDARLVNEYGPTEATVWCTVHEIFQADTRGRVPIGRPIANTHAYVLNPAGAQVPVGVPGELHIGGANVASGYLGRPDLTADRFVTLDLPGSEPERLYRTGDVVRWLPDGTLDLLGRFDHQVKIRGQRIELGEIEAVLRANPDVRDAAVITHAGILDTTVLVGYVEGAVDVAALRSRVAELLPAVMVPSVIVALDQLPRGRTGKVDRTALPEPELGATVAGDDHVAPSSHTERTLAAIWEAVLGVEKVGLTDNFFDLGGDSILSIRIIARAHEKGLALTPRQFFDSPTVGDLARLLEG